MTVSTTFCVLLIYDGGSDVVRTCFLIRQGHPETDRGEQPESGSGNDSPVVQGGSGRHEARDPTGGPPGQRPTAGPRQAPDRAGCF
jgi:hypothetical protein